MNTTKIKKESKAPYVFAGLSFIPSFGIIFGIVAIIWGITIKKKAPVLIGLGGILLTVVTYGLLFYFGFVANYGPYFELKKQLAAQLLSQTRGQILIYKEKHHILPAKLSDMGTPSQYNFYMSSDPWMHNLIYKPHTDGTFEIRSSGPDGIPYTTDDIVSKE